MKNQTMEAAVGRTVRDFRLAHGWSQQTVADEMCKRGCDWQQSTVAKTEAAQRPIRVNEVYALARVFDTAVTSLMYNESDESHGLHAYLVAMDAESVALANRREAVKQLEATDEALKAARTMLAEAQATMDRNRG